MFSRQNTHKTCTGIMICCGITQALYIKATYPCKGSLTGLLWWRCLTCLHHHALNRLPILFYHTQADQSSIRVACQHAIAGKNGDELFANGKVVTITKPVFLCWSIVHHNLSDKYQFVAQWTVISPSVYHIRDFNIATIVLDNQPFANKQTLIGRQIHLYSSETLDQPTTSSSTIHIIVLPNCPLQL